MNITKNSSICKFVSTKLAHPININSGNIIPQWWYSKILTTGGKADTIAISLLSELWFLYSSTGSKERQKDYDYFGNIFNFNQFQIRDTFIRLGVLDLMKRSICSIVVQGQGRKFSNILFVILHVKRLFETTTGYLQSGSNNDDKCDNRNQESILFDDGLSDFKETELETLKANKNKRNLAKNRSSGSIFVSNSFLEKQNPLAITSIQKQRFRFASFYPLVQLDIDKLQMLCGRKFSGKAMDSVWFGKLTTEVDFDAKKLTLKAQTKFIKDWVQSNYLQLIDKIQSMQNYNLVGVSI